MTRARDIADLITHDHESALTYVKTAGNATEGQVSVTGLTYTAGFVDVYLNGARLVVGTDVTATNGTSIVLAAGATVNDIIQIIAFNAAEAFTPASPTFTGTLTAPTINASTALQISGVAVTSTASELNLLDGVSTTAAELNILDGATVTTAELNILDGVTSTAAELNYVDGVTSNIQTQIDTKSPTASPTFTGTATAPTVNASTALQIGGVAVTSTAAELNYSDGVTSNIQNQLDGIVPGMHTVAFVANGAIANDKAVILQTDGKAAQVAIADRTRTQPDPMILSSNPIIAAGDARSHHAAAWETNGNRFVWANESGVRVGTVSGTGSNTTVVQGLEAVKLRPDGQGYYTSDIIPDPNNSGRFMVMYNYSYEVYYNILTIIGEGSGAKVQLGTKSTNYANPKISNTPQDYTPNHNIAWDKTSGKVVSVYCTEYDSANRFTAQVITVTGDECENTNGITGIHESAAIEYRRGPAIVSDPNTPGLFVVSWRQSASGSTAPNKGVMRSLKLTNGVIAPAGNVTAIPNSDCTAAASDGSQQVMSGQNICFDPTTARQLVVVEAGATEARSWIANVPDAGGAFTGDITFQSSTPLDITTDRVCIPAIAAMGQTASGEDGKYLISYYTVGTSGSPTGDWYHQIGSLDGTTMTWGTREATGDGCDIQYSSTNPAYGPNHHIAADSTYAGRAVSLIYDNEGSNKIDNPYIVEVGGVYNTTNLSGNFIGVSSAAIANTASGNVVIKGGVVTTSGLTVDTDYYVQSNGDINTTSNVGVNIGKAISTTKLLLKGI